MDIGNVYAITCETTINVFKVRAKDEDQAWRKFVAQYFREVPMKPARSDYLITRYGER